MTLIKTFLSNLAERAGLVAMLGSASGWLSWDTIAHAKDIAQFAAGSLAALVSLCALIISAPKAIATVRGWLRAILTNRTKA